MGNSIIHRQIIEYYDTCDIDYRLLWNLNKSYAMHLGYWDEKVKSFPQALERENEILAQKANIKSSDVVLDAGCGVGGSSIFLAKKFGCKAVGITLSEKQVERARRNAEKAGVAHTTEFLSMDFGNLTFPNEKFDVVWAVESACHANSKKEFLEGAYRVLKSGGRLVLADYFAAKEDYNDTEKNIMREWLSGWAVNFLETRANFERFLRDTGFQNISFSNATTHVMPSAKRLYLYSFPGMAVGKIAEFLALRTKIQTGNIVAARYQYIALRKNLCEYGIFYAEK